MCFEGLTSPLITGFTRLKGIFSIGGSKILVFYRISSTGYSIISGFTVACTVSSFSILSG